MNWKKQLWIEVVGMHLGLHQELRNLASKTGKEQVVAIEVAVAELVAPNTD